MALPSGSLLYLIIGILFLSLRVSAQCTICSAAPLPFPTREIFIQGSDVVTCEELEATAESDASLCPDLPDFAFYCGCPGVPSPCNICGEVPLDPGFENRVLKGYAPSWFPEDSEYTCAVASQMLSLVGPDQCDTALQELETIQKLCGCTVPELANCTSICSDGTLIEESKFGVEALTDQPLWGTRTCKNLQELFAGGTANSDQCKSAFYIGHKKCGCTETRPYCDICEDGSIPANLAQEVTFMRNCFEHAGDAFSYDQDSVMCKAYQSTHGIYCGCNNPTASSDACRLCDVNGGQVVPDSNLTIDVEGFLADCGELEFAGNDPSNLGDFSCEDVTEFGVDCCVDSVENLTVAPTSGVTPVPTPAGTAEPTPADTAEPTPEKTPAPTPEETSEPTAPGTPAPTSGMGIPGTSELTPTEGGPDTPVPTPAEGGPDTPAPTPAEGGPDTPAPTPAEGTPDTAAPTPAEGAPDTPAPSPATTEPPTNPTGGPLSGNGGGGCSICGDELLPFPDLLILDQSQENMTCADMEAAAAKDPALCPSLPALAFYCGCPKDDGAYCSICSDGGLVSKPELVLNGYEPQWLPEDFEFTCALAEIIHSLDSVGSCQNNTEPIATLCGCKAPEVNNCTTLCPDGTLIDPLFRNTLVFQDYPFLGTMTCEDFQFLVAEGDFYTADCDAANYAGVKACGCEETLSFCDLCADGSAAPDLRREVTLGRTCLDYAGDGYFLAPDDPLCPTFQATFGNYCGCDNPVADANATCFICGDGPVPDSNYTIIIGTPNGEESVDCGMLEFTANDPNSPFTCGDAATIGSECCSVTRAPTAAPKATAAPVIPGAQAVCSICDGTALPFPDREIFVESQENVTCGSLEASANGNASTVACADLPAFAFYCGCPGATSPCPVCPGGGLPPKPDLELKGYAPSWFPVNSSAYTCAVAEGLNSLKTSAECNGTSSDTIATLCGCFVSDDSNCSSLCPDGTLIDPAALGVAVFDNDANVGTVSCADYQLLAAEGDLLVPECDAAHYVGVKVCGCAATRPFCDICEDGSSITDLGKEITFGKTCLDHAADAYFTDPDDGVCSAIQASYGVYCGCGNNTQASADACRICDQRGGAAVPDSNQTVMVGEFMVECGNLEFTGNDPNASFTCDHVRAFGLECCAGMPTATPTAATTTAEPATSAPTPNPTDDVDGALREGTSEPTAPQTPGPTTSGAVAAGIRTTLWGVFAIMGVLLMVI